MNIEIVFETFSIRATLNNTNTAEAVKKLLPINGHTNVWGDEIYFEVDLDAPLEAGSREEVNVGDLAYWPPGKAICIFFGPTPVSTSHKPAAYSPVNVIGKLDVDVPALSTVRHGDQISIISKEA